MYHDRLLLKDVRDDNHSELSCHVSDCTKSINMKLKLFYRGLICGNDTVRAQKLLYTNVHLRVLLLSAQRQSYFRLKCTDKGDVQMY